MQFQMSQGFTPSGIILAGLDFRGRPPAQFGIIYLERFGEAGFESPPIFRVKAVGEAGNQGLDFQLVSFFHPRLSSLSRKIQVCFPKQIASLKLRGDIRNINSHLPDICLPELAPS